jgi:hypothetical protein
MPGRDGGVRENGAVDANLLKVMVPRGGRFVAGEGAPGVGQGHPLAHRLPRSQGQLLPQLGMAG